MDGSICLRCERIELERGVRSVIRFHHPSPVVEFPTNKKMWEGKNSKKGIKGRWKRWDQGTKQKGWEEILLLGE